MRFTCCKCGDSFPSRQTLGGHLSLPACVLLAKNYDKNDNDNGDADGNPNGDAEGNNTDGDSDGNAHGDSDGNTHDDSDGNTHGDSDGNAHDDSDGNGNAHGDSDGHSVANAVVLSTQELLQRPIFEYHKHLVVRSNLASRTDNCDTSKTFKLHEAQQAYRDYCKDIREQCSYE